MTPKVVCIQGPTASGKSDLAEELSLLHNGEIISADSMQIYRYMDIGTAKVTADQQRVAYHCIDFLEPGQNYSAALFQQDSRAAIKDISNRGALPILCGGTGLYVRACLDQMDFASGEQEENPVRARYQKLYEEIGAEKLHELLAQKDPQSAAAIHPNNVRRVIRAFEMLEEGESYAARKEHFKSVEPFYDCLKIALQVDRELLYERINKRVDRMVELGLVEEVENLLNKGFREGLTSQQAIGYKEIVAYLDGQCSFEEAIEQIKQSSRRYAKRQMTWLRSDHSIHWISSNEGITNQVIQEAEALLEAWL